MIKRDVVIWSLVLVIIGYAMFEVFQTNRRVTDLLDTVSSQQARLDAQQTCTEEFLGRGFDRLNERTKDTPELNHENRERVESQAALISFLVQVNQEDGAEATPAERDRYRVVLNDYFRELSEYLAVLQRVDRTQKLNPIPTREQYRNCIEVGLEKEEASR